MCDRMLRIISRAFSVFPVHISKACIYASIVLRATWWAASQAVWAADRNIIQVLTSALIQGMPHHVYDRAMPQGWKESVVACWKPYFR